MRRYLILCASLTAGSVALAGLVLADAPAASTAATQQIRFNRDIRPLLTENCFLCHGPDPGTRKAGMRFDREEGLFGERKNGGHAVIKGDPQHSLLYQRITSGDPDQVMPPPKSHKTLTAQQKEMIRQWIEQGAQWEPHWSFIAPVRSELPAVKNSQWVRNPIDRFVLARLESKGLSPAPEADKHTLVRRVTFDLTGLPPTAEEVEAFVNDASPDAYEKVVDRLLASPAYGEHRARYWLDAARYADSNGVHFDNYREMWPYRDWVINAFNRNIPFDQFALEQLAGDLLPNRTLDQQIASGFNRCNITTNEGGTIPEENLVGYTRDRTETTSRVFLGLTANCAVCHDHKFDPIPQRDFYSMSAFFNNITMDAFDGNVGNTPPVVKVPRLEDRPRWDALAAEIPAAQKQLDDRKLAARSDFDHWLMSADASAILKSIPTTDLTLLASLSEGQGNTTRVLFAGLERQVPLPANIQWQPGEAGGKAIMTPQGAAAVIPDAGDFDKDKPYTCAVWAKLPGNVAGGAVLGRMDEKDGFRGWDMYVQNGFLASHLIHHWQDDAIKVVSNTAMDPAKWHHLCVTYDGSGKGAGLKLFVDGQPQATHFEADNLRGTTHTAVPLKIAQRDSSSPINGLAVEDLRTYSRALVPAEVQSLARSSLLAGALAKPAEQRTDADKNTVFAWWLGSNDEPYKQMSAKVAALDAEQNAIQSRGATSLVMQEKNQPAIAFVLYRGDYDKRREQVQAAPLTALHPYPKDAPRNRLGFAQWLLEPENPLTARVTVNRYWEQLFGYGIVKTAGDFGIMGEAPSNQELIDWLAVEFRESKWDIKHMFKLMVMSASYRQAATDTPEKLEIDPDDRLISRGPRFRFDAETIRDNALAVSGLLVRTIGGPSVRPYQPAGVWEAVAMPGSNTRDYVQDHGEKLYRRSMYTFWKRAAPPASMDIFNAPTREVCTVYRERTDTPLQALVTMNDPQFVEAARNFAEHAIKSGGATFETRVDWIAKRLLSRPLRPEETAVTKSAFDDLSSFYRAHPEDAKKLIAVGESPRDAAVDPVEQAAWTMLCNQLMNLDEVLNK